LGITKPFAPKVWFKIESPKFPLHNCAFALLTKQHIIHTKRKEYFIAIVFFGKDYIFV